MTSRILSIGIGLIVLFFVFLFVDITGDLTIHIRPEWLRP